MQVSKDGSQFVMFCADGRVRVWKFATGKLRRSYDESLEVSNKFQIVAPGFLQCMCNTSTIWPVLTPAIDNSTFDSQPACQQAVLLQSALPAEVLASS